MVEMEAKGDFRASPKRESATNSDNELDLKITQPTPNANTSNNGLNDIIIASNSGLKH